MSYPILFSPENSYNVDLIPAIAGIAVSGKSIAGKTDTESVVESWDTQGLGVLTDAVKCRVYEEINGQYELTLEYPKNGRHYDEIGKDSIVLVEVPNEQNKQAFRVYEIEKTLRGTTEFQARHISYDLVGYPVKASATVKTGITDALNSLTSDAVVASPFTFTTNKTNTTTQFRVTTTGSIRSWLGGREGSILDKFGGEWHWDNYTCELLNRRGADNGYTIKYAKNLTSLRNVLNNEKTYTGVVCVYTDADGNTVASDVQSTGVGQLVNILSVDVTAEYDSVPTVAQLNTRAQSYITSAGLNSLNETSITLSFVDNPEATASVGLGDTVVIQCEDLNFSSRIVKSTWDVLLERYIELTVGKVVATLSDTIHSIENTVDITDTRNVLKIDSDGLIVNRPLNADADMTDAEREAYKHFNRIKLVADNGYFLTENVLQFEIHGPQTPDPVLGQYRRLNETIFLNSVLSTGTNMTAYTTHRKPTNRKPELNAAISVMNLKGSVVHDLETRTNYNDPLEMNLYGDLNLKKTSSGEGGNLSIEEDFSVGGDLSVDGDLSVGGNINNGQVFTHLITLQPNRVVGYNLPQSWTGVFFLFRDSTGMGTYMVKVPDSGGAIAVETIKAAVDGTVFSVSSSTENPKIGVNNPDYDRVLYVYYIGTSKI